ncbi:hypothetical protein PM082_016536 [Marasmius tenuissimus]|nr:hypothetical protein PM082_016536 [Marasmius tenuissimus]
MKTGAGEQGIRRNSYKSESKVMCSLSRFIRLVDECSGTSDPYTSTTKDVEEEAVGAVNSVERAEERQEHRPVRESIVVKSNSRILLIQRQFEKENGPQPYHSLNGTTILIRYEFDPDDFVLIPAPSDRLIPSNPRASLSRSFHSDSTGKGLINSCCDYQRPRVFSWTTLCSETPIFQLNPVTQKRTNPLNRGDTIGK